MVESAKTTLQTQGVEQLKAQGIDVDIDYFEANGVGVVKNFATAEECQEMMA